MVREGEIDEGRIEREFETWMEEDACLRAAYLFQHMVSREGARYRDKIIQLLGQHDEECGGYCLQNIWAKAATMGDPTKEAVYLAARNFLVTRRVNMDGSRSKVRVADDGIYFKADVPAEARAAQSLRFSGMEAFYPRDRRKKCRVVFDVDIETFEDPRALVQDLDRNATSMVKAFPAETGDLHWWAIVEDRSTEVQIRHDGRVRDLMPSIGLHGRYANLVRKQYRSGTVRREERSLGDEASELREASLRYDPEKAWFGGFLKKRLTYQGADRVRREMRDPLVQREPTPVEELGDDEASFGSIGGPQAYQGEQQATARRLDAQKLTTRLLQQLPEDERQIVAMKLEGLTDQAVGERLGLSRETVCRKFARVRRKAVALTSV